MVKMYLYKMNLISFLKSLFVKQTITENTMKKYLIVGLGNIGNEYDNTRHNIGFKILDELARANDISFKNEKLGALTSFRFKGRSFILLKPSTYMNLSGKAVQYWLTKEKIPLENLLVICDDLNISFGTIRLKPRGSAGGHNGLKSINEILNTQQYTRFRFGISDAFSKGRQVDYVLGKWVDKESKLLPERLEKAVQLVKSFGTAGIANTMSEFNGK